MSYERGFSWTEWGHERRQSEHLDHLQIQLESQRRSSLRTQQALKEQLSRMSGDLGGRIDTLSRALDTFVELSDLRFDLQVHQPAAMLRAAVRHFLVAAADSGEVPAAEFPAVSGYWLRPAVSALRARLTGRDETADLDTARTLDRRRTGVFLATALSVTGRLDDAAGHLPEALGAAGETLTRGQVTLWRASVHGHFGAAGRDLVDEWMRERLSAGPADEELWDELVRTHLPASTASNAPRPVQVAALLTRLGEHCAESLAAGDAPAGDTRPFGLLEELVDEGSPQEAPLLRRSMELRRRIEERSDDVGPPEHFDDPVGTVDAVLAEAAVGADPVVRAQAIVLAAPRLLAVAERLKATATGPFTENTRTVKRVGAVVEVGVFDEFVDLSAARATMRARHPRPDPVPWATAALITALLALVLAFPVPGLAILLGATAIGLAAKWSAVRRAAVEADSTVAWLLEALDKDVETAKATLIARREEAAVAATAATRAHTELSRLLGAGR